MKEIDIINSQNTDEIFGNLPSREEVAEKFQHEEGCSGQKTLRPMITRDFVAQNPPFNLGPRYVRETKKFLVCDECGVHERFL